MNTQSKKQGALHLKNWLDKNSTREEFAKRCGVTLATIYNWQKTGMEYQSAILIEKVTNGALKKEDLSPHIFGQIIVGE